MGNSVAQKILNAKNILLTTHREPDGDGLGAEFALYQGLRKLGKEVRILNPDKPAPKYNFLTQLCPNQCFNGPHDEIMETDLAIVLDTNDRRLLEPMWAVLEKKCKEIVFIDHHPVLEHGPKPNEGSLVDTKAASTGEVVYYILNELNVPLDAVIAKSIYTSIVFDTQIFRYIRNSPKSHQIAAELVKFEIEPGKIHRTIFGDFTKEKLIFVARALNAIEFYENDKIAFLKVKNSDLIELGLSAEHIRDLIDMVMNIDTLEAAVLVREDSPTEYKISLRSKGRIEVLNIAEKMGGGGHIFAAGAFVKDSLENIRMACVSEIKNQLRGRQSGTKA